MSLGDFLLSGLIPSRFETAARRMIEMCRSYRVTELQVWDREGRFTRTVFHPGTGLQDAETALEFNYSHINKLACVIKLCLADVEMPCVLNEERWEGRTVVYGLIYLDQLLTEARSQEEALRALADEAVRFASGLGTLFFGLANEDDSEMRLSDRVLLQAPCLFLVTKQEQVARRGVSELEGRGDMVVEWLHDPARPMEDLDLASSRARSCRDYLLEVLEEQ